MKILELHPLLTNRVQFRFSESIRTPDTSGCYALVSINDDVLYVGQSTNLRERMEQHLGNSRMTQQTSLGLASWFYYGLWQATKIQIIETELLRNFKAIEGHLPPLNRRGP